MPSTKNIAVLPLVTGVALEWSCFEEWAYAGVMQKERASDLKQPFRYRADDTVRTDRPSALNPQRRRRGLHKSKKMFTQRVGKLNIKKNHPLQLLH